MGNKNKVCIKCKVTKSLTDEFFFLRKDSKDGFRNYCKECTLICNRNGKAKKEIIKNINNIEYLKCCKCEKYKEKSPQNFLVRLDSSLGFRTICRECRTTFNYHITILYKGIKSRASKKGYKFSISISYLEELFKNQKGLCALSSIKMDCGKGKLYTSISLDRINNNKGYIKGNVQFICNCINIMKQTLNEDDFIKWCQLIVNNNNKN